MKRIHLVKKEYTRASIVAPRRDESNQVISVTRTKGNGAIENHARDAILFGLMSNGLLTGRRVYETG